MTGDPSVSVPQPNPSTTPVSAEAIHRCFDAGHDVGMRHEDGSLYSGTCHDCGTRYERGPVAPSARVDLDEIDTCDEIRSAWNRRASIAEHRAAQRLTRPEMRVDARDVRALLATIDALVAEVRRLRAEVETQSEARREALRIGNDAIETVVAERDAARAEAERLREDSRQDDQSRSVAYERLTEDRDRYAEAWRKSVAEVGRVREALQAERKLHQAAWRKCVLDGDVWPCPSVRALDAALGGAE